LFHDDVLIWNISPAKVAICFQKAKKGCFLGTYLPQFFLLQIFPCKNNFITFAPSSGMFYAPEKADILQRYSLLVWK
jgi:hypothetical protein